MYIGSVWSVYEASPMYCKDTSEKRREAVCKVWNGFASQYMGKKVKSLTSEMVASYLQNECMGKSNKTYDEHLRIIRQVLNAVLSKTGLTVNPANEVPIRKKNCVSRKPYTQEEIEDVLEAIERGIEIPYRYKTHGQTVTVMRKYLIPYVKEIRWSIMLGAWCGMRLGDAVNVTRDMWDGNQLTYTPHKTQTTSGKEVTVPVMYEPLRDALDMCDGMLTPNLSVMHERRASNLSRLYERIFRACGHDVQVECEGRRNASVGGYHALRHSFVTWCAESGVPIEVVQAVVGHSSVLTTRIYLHISNLRKAKELSKIMGAQNSSLSSKNLQKIS